MPAKMIFEKQPRIKIVYNGNTDEEAYSKNSVTLVAILNGGFPVKEFIFDSDQDARTEQLQLDGLLDWQATKKNPKWLPVANRLIVIHIMKNG